jgi:hypothetical protein
MQPSGLPDSVHPEESLSRFLFQSSLFKERLGIVLPAAFLPNKKDHETSVSRHGHDPLNRLLELGRQASGGRPLRGVGVVKAEVVFNAKLEVNPAEPPPRHAVIVGWPWAEDDQVLEKAKQKEIANILASNAELIVCPQ